MVVPNQKSSSINVWLSSKVVFHWRLSSIKGRRNNPSYRSESSNVSFHQMLSSIKGRLPSKVVFHQRLSSIWGRLSSEVSSIKGCLTFPDPVLFTTSYIVVYEKVWYIPRPPACPTARLLAHPLSWSLINSREIGWTWSEIWQIHHFYTKRNWKFSSLLIIVFFSV